LLCAASFSRCAASGFAVGFASAVVAALAGAACGLSLSSQPTTVSAVSNATDSAANFNGFILCPLPQKPVTRRYADYYARVAEIHSQMPTLADASQIAFHLLMHHCQVDHRA